MKLGIFIKKYASTILTGLGVAGVVTTAIVARNDAKRERDIFGSKDPQTKGEKIKCYLKAYWPTGLAILGSSCIIIFSNRLDAKKIAGLAAAVTLAEEKFKKYRNIVKEKLGEEEEKEIFIESAKEEWHIWPNLPESDPNDLDKEQFFYDTFSDRYFSATVERVQQAMYHLNRDFHLKGYAYLSEFYYYLGLKANDLAKTIGWSDSYYLEEVGLTPWIDFYSSEKRAENGVIYYAIYYDLEPCVKAVADFI